MDAGDEAESAFVRPIHAYVASIAVLMLLYLDSWVWLLSVWSIDSAYSHGYLVPFFGLWYLWTKRSQLRGDHWPVQRDGITIGILMLFGALAILLVGIFARARSVEAFSLIPFLLGLTCTLYGRRGLRWIAPAALFLFFMIPLPGALANILSQSLETVSTEVSVYALRIFGMACFADGNIIHLSTTEVGIAEPCNGLRMLNAFFALTVGACMIIDRVRPEKCVIALSAVPIAIAANCLRVICTAAFCDLVSPDTAQFIFHDVSGWLMVPVGFLLLAVELVLLDKLLIPAGEPTHLPDLQANAS